VVNGSVRIGNTSVVPVSVVRDLGVNINADLTMSGCLYYLLPPQRDVCDRLRHQSKFYLPATRTARFSNSFIVYGLNNYL